MKLGRNLKGSKKTSKKLWMSAWIPQTTNELPQMRYPIQLLTVTFECYMCFWFHEVNLGTFKIEYHWLKKRYTLDLSWPNRQRLEVSKNIKYIAVTLRASKLQFFKVWPGRDLNLGHPHESLNVGKLTHATPIL